MRQILVKKGRISAIAADRAILKTLEAAFDFQLSALRYRFLKRMEAQSHTTLDHLIRLLRQLSHAVAQLPPRFKGELNKGLVGINGRGQFDSEVFIEIVLSSAGADQRKTHTKRESVLVVTVGILNAGGW
jgi:hypothetical protein